MDETNDPKLVSFLQVEEGSHFPIQNLPFGVFQPQGMEPRVGVAIGEWILDLKVCEERGLLEGQGVFQQGKLNGFLGQGRAAWRETRRRVSQLLRADEPELRDNEELRKAALHEQKNCQMLLPMEIGDYTDFYSSRYHATNVGTMLRGADQALNANWLHLPVAYHGRASSVVISGTEIRRPQGQTKPDTAPAPLFGPCKALDFELEMGFVVGPGNRLGEPIAAAEAEEHIFGWVLVNDWSARDIQKWEYQPLGPFLSKSFATTVSPWVVTLDALAPFRVPGEVQDPPPLAYLQTSGNQAYNVELEAWLTPAGGTAQRISQSNLRYLYWNSAQQLAHHTINGCNLRPGDLLGTGTISGPTPNSLGCLLELTQGGRSPLTLSDGTPRRFLEDGDQLTLTGWCPGAGYRVGFGQASGVILPAK